LLEADEAKMIANGAMKRGLTERANPINASLLVIVSGGDICWCGVVRFAQRVA
jgi:hypothetical protein